MNQKRSLHYLLVLSIITTIFFLKAPIIHGQVKGTVENIQPPLVEAKREMLTTSGEKRQAIIQSGIDQIGIPYLWAGNNRGGFDCSGLIEYIFKENGLYMPRTTSQQQYFGERIDVNQAIPGDLYFFEAEGEVYHVALVLGDGHYLHSPMPGRTVSYGHIDRFEPQFAVQVFTN